MLIRISQLVHMIATSHPTSKRIQTSLIVLLDLRNIGIAFGISSMACLQAEICVIVHVFPVMTAILIHPSSRRRRVVALVPLYCLTLKMGMCPLGSRCYHVYKLRYAYMHFQFMAAISDLSLRSLPKALTTWMICPAS